MSFLLECDAPDRCLPDEDRRPGNPLALGQILPEVLESLLTRPRVAGRDAVRAPARTRGERSLRLVG